MIRTSFRKASFRMNTWLTETFSRRRVYHQKKLSIPNWNWRYNRWRIWTCTSDVEPIWLQDYGRLHFTVCQVGYRVACWRISAVSSTCFSAVLVCSWNWLQIPICSWWWNRPLEEEHWIAMSVDGSRNGQYFDSFGRPPSRTFRCYLDRHCRRTWT